MTWTTALRWIFYLATWVALFLSIRRYNELRPGRPLPQAYWLVIGVLVVLQLYGEAWRR